MVTGLQPSLGKNSQFRIAVGPVTRTAGSLTQSVKGVGHPVDLVCMQASTLAGLKRLEDDFPHPRNRPWFTRILLSIANAAFLSRACSDLLTTYDTPGHFGHNISLKDAITSMAYIIYCQRQEPS